jgi:hypothetical protein
MIEKLIEADDNWKEKAFSTSLNIMKTEYQSDRVTRSLVDHFIDIYREET